MIARGKMLRHLNEFMALLRRSENLYTMLASLAMTALTCNKKWTSLRLKAKKAFTFFNIEISTDDKLGDRIAVHDGNMSGQHWCSARTVSTREGPDISWQTGIPHFYL